MAAPAEELGVDEAGRWRSAKELRLLSSCGAGETDGGDGECDAGVSTAIAWGGTLLLTGVVGLVLEGGVDTVDTVAALVGFAV